MSGGRQEGDDGSGGAKRPSRPTALPGRICSRHCPAAPSPGHFLSHVAAFWGLLSLGDHKKGLCKFDWKWQLFGFVFINSIHFFPAPANEQTNPRPDDKAKRCHPKEKQVSYQAVNEPPGTGRFSCPIPKRKAIFRLRKSGDCPKLLPALPAR